MAEPLILAYGRGELPEFPAAADTIVDIVPVDHVVVRDRGGPRAARPTAGEPAYFHVSSGDRNPLTFQRPLRQRARLLRRAPVRGRRPRCGPAARTGGSRARRRSNGC